MTKVENELQPYEIKAGDDLVKIRKLLEHCVYTHTQVTVIPFQVGIML